MDGDHTAREERLMSTPTDPTVEDPDEAEVDDEVTSLQHDLAVANDCDPDPQDEPPGVPPG